MSANKVIIVVDFEIDAEYVFIIIKNLGLTPAFNLKIKPSAPIIGLEGKKDIGTLSVFKKISYLAPLKEMKIFVDSYESFFFNLKNPLVSFHISYKNEKEKTIRKEIVHDLKIYTDLIYFIKK
jgi:hypothetical protein